MNATLPDQTGIEESPARSVSARFPRNRIAPVSSARPTSGRRILLVDDDPSVRDSLSDVLVAEGYVVIPAENGCQALDLAAAARVDLVLLDLNMPVKNGWDTFNGLTSEHPLVPIIIVTARPNQLFTALAAGAGALLEKPMEIPILLRTIQKLLDEPPEQRAARLAGRATQFYYRPQAGKTRAAKGKPPGS